MSKPKRTKQEVDELIASRCLSVSGTYAWKAKCALWCGFEIRVSSSNPKYARLRITVTCRADKGKASMCLLWESLRVRAYCVRGNHDNKYTNESSWLKANHAHVWTDTCADRLAEDIVGECITDGDMQKNVGCFLSYCGIMGDVIVLDMPLSQGDYLDEV